MGSEVKRTAARYQTRNAWLGSLVLVMGATAFADEPNEERVFRNDVVAEAYSPAVWRSERRTIDVHMHINGQPEYFRQAVQIMNEAGVGVGVELGSGTVTHKAGEVSEFERLKQLSEAVAPGRFVHHMLLDYSGWDDSDWSDRAVEQIIEGKRLGASGLKEFKRLGLFLKDGKGQLIRVDDPKLDPVWAKCGELGFPVSIHVADPKAFWEPRDESNERWEELRDHPSWWFGDRSKYPERHELLSALSRVIARHPKTTFVTVHFANNAEELDWVDRELSSHSNMFADVAARIPEAGRHPPESLRSLFAKHQDRFVFGSDFMVNTRYILGSAGDAERPSDADAILFFQKSWKFFETDDRDWVHMTPIQGNWTISSVHLSPDVLRKIYFDNARKILAAAWPLPVMQATHIDRDFEPNGQLDEPEWKSCKAARMEYSSRTVDAYPELSTKVRALWSDKYLYLYYESPFDQLGVLPVTKVGERIGLWEGDVVEAFIGSNPDLPNVYTEYEWAPNGESLDLAVDLPNKDFAWSSKMESKVVVDQDRKLWSTEVRIPLSSVSESLPAKGTRWRFNMYRHDTSHKAFMAWSPTTTSTAHTPERFGWLEFVK